MKERIDLLVFLSLAKECHEQMEFLESVPDDPEDRIEALNLIAADRKRIVFAIALLERMRDMAIAAEESLAASKLIKVARD